MPAVLNPSGISKATREYFKLIKWLGLPVSTLLGLDEHLPLLEKGVTSEIIGCSGPIPEGEKFIQLHVGPPNNMGMMPRAEATLAILFFEGNRLAPSQLGPAKAVTVACVPSSFCRLGLIRSGVSQQRIRTVPVPLDDQVWNPQVQPAFPNEGRFRFLFMNSIYERKGLDVLLRAYWEEFSKNEPVELVIKSYKEDDRPNAASDHIRKVAAKLGVDPSRRAPISVLDAPMRDEDVPPFMRSFDAVVSTHRSEGFGLTPFYAMALGVPVISTNYGGVTDFCKDDTAWLVEVESMVRPSAAEAKTFTHLQGVLWAEPDVMSARHAMRECMDNVPERDKKTDAGKRLVAEEFSMARCAGALVDALEAASPKCLGELASTTSFVNEKFQGEPFTMLEL